MILTPLALAQLPTALDQFAAALGGHQLALRVLARIKASLDFVEGEDTSLSRQPDHHRQAVNLMTKFGLGACDVAPDQGVTWDGRVVATAMEPSVIIHEVAHFQLAPPSRRTLVDFGLGAGPESGDKQRGAADQVCFGVDCDREEALASLLGVLWEAELSQPAVLAFVEQNWLEGGASANNIGHFIKISDLLWRHGFIDADGRPTQHVASSEVPQTG